MSISTFYVAQCDICHERSQAFHAGLYSKIQTWQALVEEGWTRKSPTGSMGLVYKCPSCSTPKRVPANNKSVDTLIGEVSR